jgi:protein-S-isoprenylcysteine O-methyltransferase Ste14
MSAAIYFFSAGRTDLPIAWTYFALNLIVGLILSVILARLSPDLIRERVKPGAGEQDRLTKLVGLVVILLQLVLSGLDVGRYHWTAPVNAPVQFAALILVFVGYAIVSWAVFSNRFFSSAVRLQADRQQTVIDTGPYAYVRHPGYTGTILYLGLAGLALGSWLAFIITIIPMLHLLFRRTLLEDAMLRTGLAGYDAYAHRVKYRLLPGLW